MKTYLSFIPLTCCLFCLVNNEPATADTQKSMDILNLVISLQQQPSSKMDLFITIKASAKRHRVDPLLLAAIVSAESDGQVCAVSPAGAKGIAQMMPLTAKAYGVKNIFDPVDNINGAARYLAHLSTLANGDLIKMAAAYNYGPKAMDSMDNLPSETTGYIEKVKKRMENGQLNWDAILPQYINPLDSRDC